LRHEVVHVFNLEQTNFLVPHWLTEGLAVSNEGFKRPPQWNQLLLERVPADDLMNLDTIDLGFIRPRTPLDWQMAYCQSLLYVEFIKEKFKPERIGELLAAYRDGLDTGAAIAKVCKVDKAAFEKGYREFLQETVKELRKGKPPEKRRTLAELKKLHEEKPDDLDVTAALAEALLPRDRIQARQLAEDVTGRKRNHPLANYVLARLARLGGDVRQERDLLERGRDKDNPEPKLLLALGKVYYDAMEFAKAAEVYEQGRAAEPYENEWLLRLARVYAQTGDKDKQIAVMKDLVQTDADDLDHRKRLARMLEEAGRHDEAEQFARQTLEIDVRDKDARAILDKALRAQKKDGEADRMRKLLGE
jgi:tetratricopeptide (TPR) repeat protein